jgi:hypothetical protein
VSVRIVGNSDIRLQSASNVRMGNATPFVLRTTENPRVFYPAEYCESVTHTVLKYIYVFSIF